MKRRLLTFAAVFVLASLGLVWSQAADAELTDELGPTIEGAWRWTFTMPDGSVVRPKLTLFFEEGRLEGSTTHRPGVEFPITNAILDGNRLRFQVVRSRDSRTIVTSYAGIWQDTNITGQIESNWTGQKEVFPWNARRAHSGAEGIWSWANAFGPRGGRGPARGGPAGLESATRVRLEQDGEKLTGRTLSRFGRHVHISNGSITNNEVSFEIERTAREVKTVSRYHGKQTGDTIVGEVEFEMNGRTRKAKWEAKRAD